MAKQVSLGDGKGRQAWLDRAVVAFRGRFKAAGYTIPDHVRVSVGWPAGSRGGKGGASTVGECFTYKASADAAHEIFISPGLGITSPERAHSQSVTVLQVLSHELVHATVGVEASHGPKFRKAAVLLGHEGKMTATTAAPEFVTWAERHIAREGTFPMGKLNKNEGRKIQTTRLLKCECDTCGYMARVTKKWIDLAGAPVCPTDETPMTCDATED